MLLRAPPRSEHRARWFSDRSSPSCLQRRCRVVAPVRRTTGLARSTTLTGVGRQPELATGAGLHWVHVCVLASTLRPPPFPPLLNPPFPLCTPPPRRPTPTDYFFDKVNGESNGGNRYATVLMYLNDVEEGGETVFPNIPAPGGDNGPTFSECARHHLAAKPAKGSAVLFHSIKPSGELERRSLHTAW